jgi:hypothetical protein
MAARCIPYSNSRPPVADPGREKTEQERFMEIKISIALAI